MNIKAWIQSSNEDTSDFVLENGKLLPIEDKMKGREFMNLMFDVKRKGKIKLKQSFLEIIQSKEEKGLFLIELNAENKDIHQRRVAVMLLVEGYESSQQGEFRRLMEETFKNTTPETEVAEETIEEIITTIEGVKKNVERNFLSDPITIGVIIAGILLLILILRELCKN
jgi:hypothetical protein